MSRIRSLKPEFFRSRSLARVPLAARVTFQGLWCEADDAGRGVADPRILAGAIWPLDDDMTHVNVEEHLRALAATGHIELFLARGERFYAIVNWMAHQSASMRRGEPKYPSPEEGSPWSEPQDNILHADACKDVQVARGGVLEGSREGKGEEGRGAGTRSRRAASYTPEFETWWDEYPRKLNKADAALRWGQAIKAGMTASQSLAALAAWKRRWVAERRPEDKIPYPGTWLNKDAWREMPSAPAPQPDAIDEWFGQMPAPLHLRAIETRSAG